MRFLLLAALVGMAAVFLAPQDAAAATYGTVTITVGGGQTFAGFQADNFGSVSGRFPASCSMTASPRRRQRL